MSKKKLTLEKKIIIVNLVRKGGLTYEQIGKMHNVTRERIRQIVHPYIGPLKTEIVPVDNSLLDRIFGKDTIKHDG